MCKNAVQRDEHGGRVTLFPKALLIPYYIYLHERESMGKWTSKSN